MMAMRLRVEATQFTLASDLAHPALELRAFDQLSQCDSDRLRVITRTSGATSCGDQLRIDPEAAGANGGASSHRFSCNTVVATVQHASSGRRKHRCAASG